MTEAGPFDIRRHAAERPDALAFRMSATDERVTFAELEARANRGAHLFRASGLGVGDHVAILMENRREFLEIAFAADRAGLYGGLNRSSQRLHFVLRAGRRPAPRRGFGNRASVSVCC